MKPEKFEETLVLANQMATETITLLRADLTDAGKVRALLIGRINFTSNRNANRMSHGAVQHFIPSKDQH